MLPLAERADNKGFTLIEVMVAILIMMVGMLALLQTVSLSIAYNNSNKLRNDAIIYADEAMGSERNRVFSTAMASTGTLIQRRLNLGFVNYSVVKTYTNLSAVANHLQLRVTWRDKGIKKTHSLTTTIVNTN